MTSRVVTCALAAGVFIAGLCASASVLRAGDAVSPPARDLDRLMYIQSGPVARRMMLSFDALAADVYWMRAIQHYGTDRRSSREQGRFELLAPLLDLTTELDPHFNIAYRFGAIFLAEPPPSGPGRVDLSIALLKKGLENNPGKWQYAFDIGFIYYWYGVGQNRSALDYQAAADWFDGAARMDNAPVWIRPLAALTRAQGGDTRGATSLLQELVKSDEQWLRRAARRGLDQITAIETITRLQRAADGFVARHHRQPSSWAEIDPAIPAAGVPIDPAGVPYEYDSQDGAVRLSAQSPLYPLPDIGGAS